MTEQGQPHAFRWERSPNYRTFFSNFFKFRFSAGDASVTFSQFDEDPGSPTQNIIQEQVNITLSWVQLKQLGRYIEVAVQEMEGKVGPIANIGLTKEELRDQAIGIINDFQIQKQ